MSIADKQILFAGALANTTPRNLDIWSPRTTMGKIVGRALASHGYSVDIDLGGFGANNAPMVASGKADLGALNGDAALAAYEGKHEHGPDGPMRNLRAIAAIHFPAWLGVAVRWDTGITDLSQIKERKMPVRVVKAEGEAFRIILDYYGLSREMIESWGGQFVLPGGLPLSWVVTSGHFDVVMDSIYAAYTPEARRWWESSVLHNLRFLPLPDDLIQRLCEATGGTPGHIPHQLMRGVMGDIPSVARPPHVIYGRDDMPEDFAYLLTKALDENRNLFREVFIPFSYDPRTVAHSGMPLHPGAERYYREVGYLAREVSPVS
jgi:TRAP-type uncharacterized transport system substrate-binding protein